MSLDELQQRWQSQGEARLSVRPELLLAEVRRNQRNFKTMIFWRDFREVFVAAALVVWFAWDGFQGDGWPWFLCAGMCLFVGGFILVDRFLRRGRAARFGDSLLGCVEASLEDVEHQIWLLRNVFWWYLLPLAIGMTVALIYMAADVDDTHWFAWTVFLFVWLFCAAVFVWVYRINQAAVKAHLEPRRQELLAVRESLLQEGEES
jgi:hypothetical protein